MLSQVREDGEVGCVIFSLLMCCGGWIVVVLVHILLLFSFLYEVGCMLFPLYPSLLHRRGLLEKR